MCEEKRVYLDPCDLEPYEYEIELTCPHCGETFMWFTHEIIFEDEKVMCDECGQEFLVYSQP